MSASGQYKGTVTELHIYKPPLPIDWVLIKVKLDISSGGLWMRGLEAVHAVIQASKAGELIQYGTRVIVTLHASKSSKANTGADEIATLDIDHGEDVWLMTGREML